MMSTITRLAPRQLVAASKTSVTNSLTWPTVEVCEGTVCWKAAIRFAIAVSCAAIFFLRGRFHPDSVSFSGLQLGKLSFKRLDATLPVCLTAF